MVVVAVQDHVEDALDVWVVVMMDALLRVHPVMDVEDALDVAAAADAEVVATVVADAMGAMGVLDHVLELVLVDALGPVGILVPRFVLHLGDILALAGLVLITLDDITVLPGLM